MGRIFFITCILFFSIAQGQVYRAVLEPLYRTMISSEITSTVEQIEKKMGQPFSKGDLLILLDDNIFAAYLLKNQALVRRAEADYEAKSRLYKERAISHSEIREAEANLASAKAELVVANEAVKNTRITAPYDGKVIDVHVKEYERVEPGQKLIEILDDHILTAKLLLPETFLNKLTVGDNIALAIEEIDKVVHAKIVRIGAIINPASSLIKVDAEIVNTGDLMRAGMEGYFNPDPKIP